jgi:hypothetical protein
MSTSFGAPNCWSWTSPRLSAPIVARMDARSAGRFRLDLHQGAADEIDAEIEPVKEVQQDRRDRQRRRDGEADAPEAHEVETSVVGDDAKQAHGVSFR